MSAPLTWQMTETLYNPFELASPSNQDVPTPNPAPSLPSEEVRKVLEMLVPLSASPGIKRCLLSQEAISGLSAMHKVLLDRLGEGEDGKGDSGTALTMVLDCIRNLVDPKIDISLSSSPPTATGPSALIGTDPMVVDGSSEANLLLCGPIDLNQLNSISSELGLDQIISSSIGTTPKIESSARALAAVIEESKLTTLKSSTAPPVTLGDLKSLFESALRQPQSPSSLITGSSSLIASLVEDRSVSSYWDYCRAKEIYKTIVVARKLTKIEATAFDKAPGLGIAASELFGGEGMTRRRRPRDGGRSAASVAAAKAATAHAMSEAYKRSAKGKPGGASKPSEGQAKPIAKAPAPPKAAAAAAALEASLPEEEDIPTVLAPRGWGDRDRLGGSRGPSKHVDEFTGAGTTAKPAAAVPAPIDSDALYEDLFSGPQ